MPLRDIKQTSRTILFEEFCKYSASSGGEAEAIDLATILRNNSIKQNKEQCFKEITDSLGVRSFEEFVKKFMPVVWEWTETSDDGKTVDFRYSLERPEHVPNAHAMSLDKNEFYAMVMDLYSCKGHGGSSNLNFDYSKVSELLSPQKVIERAKNIRKDLAYNYNKLLELDESRKQEKAQLTNKVFEIRQEIAEQYQKSITGLIKLALADTQAKLKAIAPPANNDGTLPPAPPRPCLVSLDNEGNLNVEIIAVENNNAVQSIETKRNNEMLALGTMIGDDYNENAETQSDFIRDIVVSTYTGASVPAQTLDRDKLIADSNKFMALYRSSQENFIRAISSAVERVLNVKAFFEQACAPGKRLPADLIVANCKPEALIENGVADNFEQFLKELSCEKTDQRMWFAIIPSIGSNEFVDIDEGDVSLNMSLAAFKAMKEKQTTVKTTDGEKLTSISALKQMLDFMQKYHITTFFSFRANEKTGFSSLNSEIIDKYRSLLSNVEGNQYAVFAYPNFTVLPKKETYIPIGDAYTENGTSSVFLDIPGIYIDASYVAAGLIVGSQDPNHLKAKGLNVEPNNPCVRFDIEDNTNRFALLTTMNREGSVEWLSEVGENIGKDNFGFCFCGNIKYDKGKKIMNTYVYTARTMRRDSNGMFEPIFETLTMDFVSLYLKTRYSSSENGEITKSELDKFIKEEVNKWQREAENDKVVNNVLSKRGDTVEKIEFSDDDYTVHIKFIGSEKKMPIKVIKDN